MVDYGTVFVIVIYNRTTEFAGCAYNELTFTSLEVVIVQVIIVVLMSGNDSSNVPSPYGEHSLRGQWNYGSSSI